MNQETRETCTWCKGAGVIKSRPSPWHFFSYDWSISIGAIAIMVSAAYLFGESHGWLALTIIAVAFIGAWVLPPLLWIAEAAGLMDSKKPCPHCQK